MFRTASGPSAGIAREMQRPHQGVRSQQALYVLKLLMAASTLGMGLLGGFILFKVWSHPTDLQQAETVSPEKLAAEIAVQRQKMVEQSAMDRLESSPSAVVPPPAAALSTEQSPPTIMPGARPLYRKRTKRNYKLSKLRPRSNSPLRMPQPPSPAELRMQAIADDVEDIQFTQMRLAGQLAKVNAPLASYLAEQIAALRVDQQNIGNRVAVTEDTTQRLREGKSWYDWLAIGVTAAATIHGLLKLAITILEERRAKSTLPIT